MNYFETITKFLPQAVDKYFAAESQSVILEHGAKYIDVNFDEAGYVKVADILLDGLSNYYRTQEQPYPPVGMPADPYTDNPLPGYGSGYGYDGYAAYAGNVDSGVRDGFDIGGTSVRWEIYKLQWCRGRQFRIDHISNEETAKVLTGGLIEEFHRLKVIPEVDACRFSTIADAASVSLGNLLTETIAGDTTPGDEDITESNVLAKFFAARKWLVEHEVPLEDLVWFVSPDVYTLIMNSDKLVKFITQSDYRSENGVTFEIKKFNGTPIVEVVPSRFFTKIQVTRNGYQASANSQAINYIMCSKKAILPVRKIEYQKMYDENMAGVVGFYGTIINYLLYHGVIIPRNKLVGTFVSVRGSGTALSKTNVLSVDIRAGAVQYAWKLNAYFTAPSGLRGNVVYAPAEYDDADLEHTTPLNPFTVGQTVTVSGTTKYAFLNVDNTEAASGVKYFFALVDYRGICIATTPTEVTLVQHA